jgi:aminoacrylate hydrolase
MHYEIHGPDAAPTLVLSSGLGGAAHYWAPQLPALTTQYRVLAYDQLGTGKSPGTLPDSYTIAHMAAELADLLHSLGITQAHFMGHALGGLIGLQLALDHPDLIQRMVLVNAWAKTHPHTLRCFAARKHLLRNTGAAAYVAAQPIFLYPAGWMASRTDWLAEQDKAGTAHFPPHETVLARIGAIESFDLTTRVHAITAPTCVIATHDDILVPSTCSVALADALPNAELVLLEKGGHACNITDPDGFNTTVTRFLAG